MSKMLLKQISLEINTQYLNRITAKQNDNGRYLLFRLLDNGVPFSLKNRKVRFFATKPDGKDIFNDLKVISEDNGLTELHLTEQMLISHGELEGEIVIYEGVNVISSNIITVEIIQSNRESKILSTNEFSALTLALKNIDDWDKYFTETSGKIEEKYTERLNSVSSQLSEKVNTSDMQSEMVSRRVRGQNSTDSPAGSFDSANFAGQTKGKSAPIGNVFHHYTDGKLMQIDNVGENNVIITIVNAHNSVRRPDKPADFHGTGYYFQLMTNNPTLNEVISHLVVDEKANLFWNGVDPEGRVSTPTLTSAKDDGGYPAFLFKAIKKHGTLFRLENGSGIAQLLINRLGNRCDIVSASEMSDGLHLESKKGGIRLQAESGNIDLVNSNIRKNHNGLWFNQYPTIYGTTANRPTDIAGKYGMPYFDMNLNKMIYVNNVGNGWIDAMGNSV